MTRLVRPFLVLLVAGCAQQYASPSANDPHGVIKFRRSYQESKGSRLTEKLHVGDERAFVFKGKRKVAEATRTDAVAVTPGQHVVTALAEFWTTQSNGDSTSKVVLGKCKQSLPVKVEAGGVYLLQLNYQNKRVCTVECYEQTPTGSGEFVNTPCE